MNHSRKEKRTVHLHAWSEKGPCDISQNVRTQTCTRISFEGNEDQSIACSKITGTLETLQSRNWYTNCTTDDSPSNADDDATIPVAKHVAAQCFQWYDSVSRCTTSSSSQASGAGAASTNVVASSEWRMEVCRCIVNLISIVKLSDFQFHMCVITEMRMGGGQWSETAYSGVNIVLSNKYPWLWVWTQIWREQQKTHFFSDTAECLSLSGIRYVCPSPSTTRCFKSNFNGFQSVCRYSSICLAAQSELLVTLFCSSLFPSNDDDKKWALIHLSTSHFILVNCWGSIYPPLRSKQVHKLELAQEYHN